MNKPKVFTPQVKEQIIKMYASGIKARDIATRTGLNHSGVKCVLAKANKNDTVLKRVHEEHYAPQRAIEWWDRQTPQFRRDASRWLDVLTVEEMYEACCPSFSTSMFEDAHDC